MFQPTVSDIESQYSSFASGVNTTATRLGFFHGLQRRWQRERRRRKVGRAYDMALEIARSLQRADDILDVGCGNGFIAHHLAALLGSYVLGIDVGDRPEASINFQRYDGQSFPVADNSFEVITFCYVLHHAQNVKPILKEVRRVLRADGSVVIYEDIPATWWDKAVCALHNLRWKNRTGPCRFYRPAEWCKLFEQAGFEISYTRSLSRMRNFAHPLRRQLFVLRLAD